MVQLVEFYNGREFDFDLHLLLKASEVPVWRLGEKGRHALRLGWSTWLRTPKGSPADPHKEVYLARMNTFSHSRLAEKVRAAA